MQRWLILGAVIATLGALLYLHLEPEASSSLLTAEDEPRGTSWDGARQWLPWGVSLPEGEAHESGPPAEPSGMQPAVASEEDVPDLPGTFSLWGQVTDENGQPIEKVRVRARPSDNSFAETRARCETDAQGRFRLRSLFPGHYDISFQRDRFLPQKLETWALTANPPPLTVMLLSAPTIQGRVVDASGTPLGEARVELYKLERRVVPHLEPSPPGELAELRGLREKAIRSFEESTLTDSNGTFILDAPKPGTWIVQAEHEGFNAVEREVSSPAKDVWLVLGVGTRIDITVVDEQDRPVPHASVGLWRDGGDESFTAKVTTDEAGHAGLQGLEAGQYGLVAMPPEKAGFRTATASLTVRGEKAQQVLLRFQEGLRLSGVVTNRAGTPLPEVEVRASALLHPALEHQPLEDIPASLLASLAPGVAFEDSSEWRAFLLRLRFDRFSAPLQGRTGPDGRFTLPHLLPFSYRVSFEKKGYALAERPSGGASSALPGAIDVSPSQGELRVVLTYNGRVSGRVVRAGDGEPLTHFLIDGEPYTSPDGTFTLTAGEPGAHTMKILVPEVGGLHREYETREGEDVDLGDLVLGEGRPVRVRVENSVTSLPISDVRLQLQEELQGGEPARVEQVSDLSDIEAFERIPPEPGYSSQQEGPRALTELELGVEDPPKTTRDGTCLLPDVPTRPLVLLARRKGYEPARVALSPEEHEVTLRLRPWATVQGWVRVGGEPIAEGDVNFYTLEGDRLTGLEVRNGWYSGHHFPPGTYMVQADCDSCPAPKPVFVAQFLEVPGPGGRLSLDWQEARGATLEVLVPPGLGRLTLLQGHPPLPTTSKQYDAIARAHHPREHLESTPGFRFRDVPPGRYTLLFSYERSDGNDFFQRREVDVPVTGVLRIELPPDDSAPREHAEE
ncbi:carboxypeptidase-like regulatory domain-containing protein [Hyalangium sp.]|uniref:carboxypeptidase-like regulatory domain-containing protein n=1 Tax=Hyalangium sp. TaxID=2028555 RepID=UPI002D332D4B|nr:carboxypeptidase-like regulatory domain-containing protein [Hyalangium sp.]HYH95224.1 carboxypeptidase-like regulatory domain-containing protein [Hyalangium sp.]